MNPEWQAKFEDGTLHISGTVKYPRDFVVAGLERIITRAPEIAVYRIVFHQDKEHFCDLNLIGAVHHFEPNLPPEITRIRVLVDNGQVEIEVPKA